MEELFLGSVLTIVLGTSLIAHAVGFSYSLGAFIAGMIIAETHFHIKVESDIASYKDLLLGAFFFSIGSKINITYFLMHIDIVIAVLFSVMLIKALLIYVLIRRKSNKSDSLKTSLALCQVGEFSFAIFAVASNEKILNTELSGFLILVTVLSMIVTPFMVNNIYKLAALFVTEYFEADKITPIEIKQHTVICGFTTVARIVARELQNKNVDFVIISNNLQHVLVARKRGYHAYFGHLDKQPVLESLKIEHSANIILTLDSLANKKIICEAVLEYYPQANLLVKINNIKEKRELADLNIRHFVHGQYETAQLLVNKSD